MSVRTISSLEFAELCKKGQPVDFIDVRTPVEYDEVHAVGTRLVPLDQLDPKDCLASRLAPADQPIYVICKSGARAAKACEKFIAAGIDNVISVEGGTNAWVAAGLPCVRGKKAISLERQVRIAAGLLVVLGVVLGYYVHHLAFLLSGFVGAGLTFAGITDTCGMGMMLAKMPWNQRCVAPSSCSISCTPPEA